MSREAVIKIWNSIEERVVEYLKDTEYTSVIAHGSFAEGIANKNSDFDLFVICKETVQEREEVQVFSDIEVHFEFIHKENLLEQLKSLDNLLLPEIMGFSAPLASRLKNAVVLIDEDNEGAGLIELAQQFKPSDSLLDRYSRSGFNYYYDAVGAMLSGDYTASIHMARIGALHIMTGALLKKGMVYVKNKWLVKLEEKSQPLSEELFLRLMGLDTADKERAHQCILDLNKMIAEFQHLRETDD
jgi:predicted nucleotidyltransferase